MAAQTQQVAACNALHELEERLSRWLLQSRAPCWVLSTGVFRVILVTDALCSSADETHDAMMNVYTNRFGEQAETVTTNTLLESWPGKARERRAS
jgi:hypothetical protein